MSTNLDAEVEEKEPAKTESNSNDGMYSEQPTILSLLRQRSLGSSRIHSSSPTNECVTSPKQKFILEDPGAESGAEGEVKTGGEKFDEQKYERKIGADSYFFSYVECQTTRPLDN